MKNCFLEAGRITSPHGVRGEVKIVPWADSPDYLCGFEALYINGSRFALQAARVHKNTVIAKLDGIESINDAEAFRGKTVCIDRGEAELPEGRHFIVDLIGLEAIDNDTGERLGIIKEILPLEPNSIYVIDGAREILVPAVDEFLIKVDIKAGCVRFHLIEGM